MRSLARCTFEAFYGRRSELTRLVAAVDRAVGDGSGSAFLVSGGGGIGKSRLLREFRSLARPRAAVLSGAALEYARVPYGPLVEAFADPDASEVRSALEAADETLNAGDGRRRRYEGWRPWSNICGAERLLRTRSRSCLRTCIGAIPQRSTHCIFWCGACKTPPW